MKTMKSALAWIASGSLVLLSAGNAAAQTAADPSAGSTPAPATQLPMVGPSGAQAQASPTPPPPPQVQVEAPAEPATAAPDANAQVAAGQWVYTSQYGWVWVPAGTESSALNEQPYAYLYAPSYGWAWYASPWGWGPAYYGPWASYFGPRFWGGHYHYGVGGWGYSRGFAGAHYGPGGFGHYGVGGRGWGGGYARGGGFGAHSYASPGVRGGAHFGGGGGHFGGGAHFGGGGGHFGGGGGHFGGGGGHGGGGHR
jgi:hypothetical protein